MNLTASLKRSEKGDDVEMTLGIHNNSDARWFGFNGQVCFL